VCHHVCRSSVVALPSSQIITDYLLAAGAEVFHILGRGHVDKAQMTPGAKINEAGALTYPAAISKEVFST
jgi:hypothetical protein